MIHIDEIWLPIVPMVIRTVLDKTLGRMIEVFCAAPPHHDYLFGNRRGNRMKVLIRDGLGFWWWAGRLHRSEFHHLHSANKSVLAVKHWIP